MFNNILFSGGSTPSVLQEITVPVIENPICQDMYYESHHKKIIKDSFLCAGYADGQMDSCDVSNSGRKHCLI